MEQYPDDWIGIAIHDGDYITSNDFKPLVNKVSGFPSCFVDRAADIYPLYVAQYMPQFLQNPSSRTVRFSLLFRQRTLPVRVTSFVISLATPLTFVRLKR